MQTFRLKIDLLRGQLLEWQGFDRGVSWEGPSRLLIRSKLTRNGYDFFLSGRIYSFTSENMLHRWLDGFSPEAISNWAKEIDGDLAMCVFDTTNSAAYLVSDRNGAARVYYSYQRGRLCVSNSRLELTKVMDGPRLSSHAVYQLLALGYVLDPQSLIQDSRVTFPGQIASFSPRGDVTVTSYFSPVRMDVPYLKKEAECISALDAAYRETFEKRLTKARVPCVLLSGGIDSVTILKYIKKAYAGRIVTLTFSFKDLHPNELEPARIAARYFGTDHHEVVVDPEDSAGLIVRTLEADAQDGTSLMYPAVIDYLKKLGGQFDIFTGQDTRLHTPSFDLAREIGIQLNSNPASNRNVRALAELASRWLLLWPVEGSLRHYLQHWSNNLRPRADLATYVIQALTSFYLPKQNGSRPGEHYRQLLATLPKFEPEDNLQVLFKKYVGFEYRTQYTDDMSCLASTLTSPVSEIHFPFYDWEAVEASNLVPYHLGMRGNFTLRSWNKMPFVRKRIARALVRGSVPESLLYRAKKTCPHHDLVFNRSLAEFAKRLLKRWLAPLAESCDSEVRSILLELVQEFSSRSTFDLYDVSLLFRIQSICYLAVLNQACMDRSFQPSEELRMFYGGGLAASAESRSRFSVAGQG
jgi:hypothetical protein